MADRFGLVQKVEEPTIEKNKLDLIFTNDVDMFTQVEVTGSSLSDHNQIEITTNITGNNQKVRLDKKEYREELSFWHQNFHHEDVSWINVNKEISDINWATIFSDKDTKTCTNMLMILLKIMCVKFIPIKKQRNKNRIPRERKKLLNRIKMLKKIKTSVKRKEKRK